MDYETSDLSNVFQELESSTAGLTEEEAESRLGRYGFNELEEKGFVIALGSVQEYKAEKAMEALIGRLIS